MRSLVAALLGVSLARAQDNASANATANATNVTVVPDPVPYELEAAGISVRVLGSSGKIEMIGAEDGQMVRIEMDSLRELDANGEAVGANGQDRHSINTFANQDFTFHPVVTDHMMGVDNLVTANKLSFESPVGSVGNISVDTFIMRSRGHVGPLGEEWGVRAGDMKFNVRFPNWRWCGDEGSSCRQNEIGAFLELKIKIKGAADEATLVEGTDYTYNLGGNANLTLTNKVTLDGEQSLMAPGYPQLGEQGSSQIFTFRFPRFESSAEYDPLLSQDWVEESDDVTEDTQPVTEPVVESQDLETTFVTVRVLGNSGKMRVFDTEAGHNDANAIVIEMDSLEELDASGASVGASGQDRHSIQTFANQDFTFVEPHLVQIGVNSSVNANKLSFESSIGDVGSIAVDTFVMGESGVVGPEGDLWGVAAGDMKFNVRFPSWRWCGDVNSSCPSGEVGAFLELRLKIKGADAEVTQLEGTNVYDLGGNMNLTLTEKVMLDGEQGVMAPGYPRLETQGNSQIFVFRFPRFSSSADYDPLIRQGWHFGEFNNFGGYLSGASGESLPLLTMVFMFFAIFVQ